MTSFRDPIHLLGARPAEPVPDDRGEPLTLQTDRGDFPILYHPVAGGQEAVIWLSGFAGGYNGPANNIFKRLGEELVQKGVASIRSHYRSPGQLEDCVRDTFADILFLRANGYRRIALVGHSFGGAVVISVAPYAQDVVAAVTLSSQTFGATGAGKVAPRPMLIVHGTADTRLPSYCSEQIYLWAKKPKELVLYEGATHGLGQCAEELHALLSTWLPEKLKVNPNG